MANLSHHWPCYDETLCIESHEGIGFPRLSMAIG